jgi:hypothetical protein
MKFLNSLLLAWWTALTNVCCVDSALCIQGRVLDANFLARTGTNLQAIQQFVIPF